MRVSDPTPTASDPELGSCLFCADGGRPVLTDDAALLYSHVVDRMEGGMVHEDFNWGSHKGLAIVCLECCVMLPSLDDHMSIDAQKAELARVWNCHRKLEANEPPPPVDDGDYSAETDNEDIPLPEESLKQGGTAAALFDD